MDREKQLIKNTIIVAIGQICTKFISFFLLPLYTAYLSTDEFGIVDLFNTYIFLIIPILFFQVDQAVFRFLIENRKNDEKKSEIISSSFWSIAFQIIIYMSVFFFVSRFIKNEYKVFLILNTIITMLSGYYLQISRGLGDNITYSIGSLIAGAGTVILNVFLVAVVTYGTTGMLLATFISNLMCIGYVFIKLRIYNYIKIKNFKKKMIIELWKYSFPLIPNQLSWWAVNASDRTIVSFFISIGATGTYAVASKVPGIINTIFNIFNLTWTESAALHIQDKDSGEFFSKIFNSTMKLFICLCFIIIASMPLVFNFLITGDDYYSAYYQIPILIISTIFSIMVSLIGSIYVALKETKKIAKTSIYSAIINIVVNIALIKYIGLYAASISTLIAFLIMAIYRLIDVKKYLRIKINMNIYLLFFIYLIIIIPFYYIRNIWISTVILVIILIQSIYINKNEITELVYIIKNKIINNRSENLDNINK